MSYNHVALIGLGLIASSIIHAGRRGMPDTRFTGTARSAETRQIAREIELCEVHDAAAEAVAGADLVILCVPVGAMATVAAEIAPHLKPGAVVSDVGSVKAEVISAVAPQLPDTACFIPAHPVAGTEHSGPRSGFAELFDNRWCLLTPIAGTEQAEVDRLAKFWIGLGAKVDTMPPDHHDLVLAVTSHAPHLIAYTMVGVADDMKRVTQGEVIQYSAAGFRDFTRIAASDPEMWRDVFLNNRDATLEILGRFTEELFALQRAIRTGDGEMLNDYFTRTRAIRRGIIDAGQDTDQPDFGGGRAHMIRALALATLLIIGSCGGRPDLGPIPAGARAVCRGTAIGIPMPDIRETSNRQCGINNPVRLVSVAGVPVEGRTVLGCGAVRAFARWVDRGMQPALDRHLGSEARSIRVVASYQCRTRNNQPGAPISEHGRGTAVDIAGMTLADGTRVSVLRDWGKGDAGRALSRMHDAACGPFGVVLGPEADRFHRDHFHFDISNRRRPYCR